ncbi:response regulator [Corynebacterium casei]|uniref:response regulator n=2 Tax=Corynebacterium casei TaxID=160386 RepID=UPI001865BF8A|nr:response regulator transcription factor [Corynebacterium casei]
MTINFSNSIRVLIVDDDPMVLHFLGVYFETTEDIQVVAEARAGAEALSLLDNITVDIILADICMPNMDGLELLHEIQKRPNPPLFIAMTALDTDDTMLKVLADGGAGYIVKSARPCTIITALRDAVEGGITVSPRALKRLAKYLFDVPQIPYSCNADEHFPRLDSLKSTEKMVLRHLCDGKSDAEISELMNYAESTVRKHVSHLISLFEVKSRLSLVVKVLGTKYIDH